MLPPLEISKDAVIGVDLPNVPPLSIKNTVSTKSALVGPPATIPKGIELALKFLAVDPVFIDDDANPAIEEEVPNA
jgi:hypothetical protein